MNCLLVSCGTRGVRLIVLLAALGGLVPRSAWSADAAEAGAGASTVTDGLGNVTRTWTSGTYGIVAGQSKLISVTIQSRIERVDGSVTQTDPYTIEFEYGAEPMEPGAELSGARLLGEIHSTTTDGFGNVTESWSSQTYDIILGQAKLSTVTTRSQGRSHAGTTTVTAPHVVRYPRDCSSGSSTQSSGIVWGQAVLTQTSTCWIVSGQALVTQSTIILGQAK